MRVHVSFNKCRYDKRYTQLEPRGLILQLVKMNTKIAIVRHERRLYTSRPLQKQLRPVVPDVIGQSVQRVIISEVNFIDIDEGRWIYA